MSDKRANPVQRLSESEVIKSLLPFAKAADDYEPPRHERRMRDEEHVALSLTVGHLRKARRMVLELIESRPATTVTPDRYKPVSQGSVSICKD